MKNVLKNLGVAAVWTLSLLVVMSPLQAEEYADNSTSLWQNDLDKMILSVEFVNEPFKNVVEEI